MSCAPIRLLSRPLRWFALYESQLHRRPLTTKVGYQRDPLSCRNSVRIPAKPARAVRIHFVRLLHGRRVCRVATQAVTAAVIGGVGDLTCQVLVETREDIDMRRLCVFSALGGILIGPALHRWYTFLHRNVPGEGLAAVAPRLLLDQLCFAPLFIPTFMVALGLLEGHPLHKALHKAERQWWSAVVANWQLWVPCQLINFGLVPTHFQVLFANGVACIWNVYLSFLSHHHRAAAVPDGGHDARS